MKHFFSELFISIFSGIIIPTLLICGLFRIYNRQKAIPAISQTSGSTFPICILNDDEFITMDLDKYVLHVIAAEMSANFELEAIKAQAIASRTYAAKVYLSGGKHGQGSVCTNPGCCQSFQTDQERVETVKFQQAVAETSGVVLTYDGELIEATYFSCSGGSTEDAREVWGTEYPYLTAKTSPDNGESVISEDKIFTKSELEELLNVVLPHDSSIWFLNWTYTAGGGVSTVAVGNRVFSGTQIRKILGLRSTLFSVTVSDTEITFHTEGYGHRVGMSQYGADFFALQGKNCEEILEYYYSGTKLVNISEI